MASAPRPFIGLAAGIAAGLVATAAMAAFRARADDDEEAGGAGRYVVGAAIGGVYGVLTEYRPEASAGFGSAYGVATSALLEDSLEPAGDEVAIHGVASHLVFGLVLEGVRWLIAGRR